MLRVLIGIVAEMLSALWRQWKLYPVTTFMVTASLALYAFTRAVWMWEWFPYHLAETIRYGSENLGWFGDLLPIADVCGLIEGRDQQLVMEEYGALGITKLWDGEVWRLLVSAFHHAFPMHIGGNLLVIWFLGIILEDELSKLSYILFFLTSGALSVACQTLVLDPCVGLSGTGYAIFGMLVILRLREPRVAMQVPKVFVTAGVVSLVACLPITYFGFLPIANVAHFSGFFYGLLAGWVTILAPRVWPRWSFAAAHILLVPLAWATVDPFWNEQYVEANMDRKAAETDDPAERVVLLKALQAKYPDDMRYRVRLVSALFTNDQREEAWRTAIEGWTGSYSQSQHVLIEQISGLWKLRGTPEDREQAEAIMDEVLGDKSARIKDRLDLAWLSVESVKLWQQELTKTDQQVAKQPSPKTGPPIDVDAPESAALGQRL